MVKGLLPSLVALLLACAPDVPKNAPPPHTVVIEFESLAQAVAAHDSPAYQEALAALGDGAERDIRLVEGV